jgi:hypothetical protein
MVFILFASGKTKMKAKTYSKTKIIREKLAKNKENIAQGNRAGAPLT